MRVITRNMSWHASSHVNYTSPSRVNNNLHEKFGIYMWKTVWYHTCRNETIFEWYHSQNLNFIEIAIQGPWTPQLDYKIVSFLVSYLYVVLLQCIDSGRKSMHVHWMSAGTLQACGYIQSVYCCMLTPCMKC